MTKSLLPLLVLGFLAACGSTPRHGEAADTNSPEMPLDTQKTVLAAIETPAGFTLMQEIEGDLDKDGIAEKVRVYNTSDTLEFGTVRVIHILKQTDNAWTVWHSSPNAILKSGEGGMMGEPYGGVEIANGILRIHHEGGSSWKWGYTDKYRFQHNEFQLIGYSSLFGKPCEYFSEIDFNLSTGQLNYAKTAEKCEDDSYQPSEIVDEQESFVKKGIEINLGNRHLNEIKIVSPKNGYEIYL